MTRPIVSIDVHRLQGKRGNIVRLTERFSESEQMGTFRFFRMIAVAMLAMPVATLAAWAPTTAFPTSGTKTLSTRRSMASV